MFSQAYTSSQVHSGEGVGTSHASWERSHDRVPHPLPDLTPGDLPPYLSSPLDIRPGDLPPSSDKKTWGPTLPSSSSDLSDLGTYHPPQTSDLGTQPSPATDTWGSSLVTCSNLFTWGHPPPHTHTILTSNCKQAVCILLECCLYQVLFLFTWIVLCLIICDINCGRFYFI